MPVLIIEKHLVASDKRMTYSDTKQKGFALRTTPNGVFTFYHQHLNEKDRQARLAPDLSLLALDGHVRRSMAG